MRYEFLYTSRCELKIELLNTMIRISANELATSQNVSEKTIYKQIPLVEKSIQVLWIQK